MPLMVWISLALLVVLEITFGWNWWPIAGAITGLVLMVVEKRIFRQGVKSDE